MDTKKIDSVKIDSICMALLNKGINRLKEPIEYLNEDMSLDVYSTVKTIMEDTSICPSEKLQFFYDELFKMYGKKKNVENINVKKAA
jgi:hypothetical protein